MKAIHAATLACLLLILPNSASAQSDDFAAERSRLGNQRIQAEAARRAHEENELKEQIEAKARVQAEAETSAARARVAEKLTPHAADELAPARKTRIADNAPSPNVEQRSGNSDLSQTLEQLRKLGELQDAGYLTDEEFQRIKDRILESGL